MIRIWRVRRVLSKYLINLSNYLALVRLRGRTWLHQQPPPLLDSHYFFDFHLPILYLIVALVLILSLLLVFLLLLVLVLALDVMLDLTLDLIPALVLDLSIFLALVVALTPLPTR